jgi:hypothetical protein
MYHMGNIKVYHSEFHNHFVFNVLFFCFWEFIVIVKPIYETTLLVIEYSLGGRGLRASAHCICKLQYTIHNTKFQRNNFGVGESGV